MLRADLTSVARNKLASMRDIDQELVIGTIRSLCLTDGREPKARGIRHFPKKKSFFSIRKRHDGSPEFYFTWKSAMRSCVS